jgi:hypothetical protein
MNSLGHRNAQPLFSIHSIPFAPSVKSTARGLLRLLATPFRVKYKSTPFDDISARRDTVAPLPRLTRRPLPEFAISVSELPCLA